MPVAGLMSIVTRNGLGIVFPSDTGFILSRQAPTMRGLDVASVRAERAAGVDPPCSGYAVLQGERAPDDALARELGAMGLL